MAIAHLPSPDVVNVSELLVAPRLQAMVAAETIDRVCLADSIETDLLAIPDPSVLSLRPPGRVGLKAGHVVFEKANTVRSASTATAAAVGVCREVFSVQPQAIHGLLGDVDRRLAGLPRVDT